MSLRIGDLAARTGVPAKTIRYYESIGLMAPPSRTESGYRAYGETDVQIMRFIARARRLGFGVDECRELLGLWRDRERTSADVKRVANRKIAEIDARMAELAGMRDALDHLAARCHGDERPDCPILEDLAGSGRRG